MAITRQGLGLAEFLELPEEKPALEYEAGRITQKVSPKAKHGRLQFRIAALIEAASEAGQLGLVFTELRTTFCRGVAGARCGLYQARSDSAQFRWRA